MPVPELLRVQGRTDLLVPVGLQQPPAATPAWNAATRHRTITRTVTLHYCHGWKTGDWKPFGSSWFGATFNIDLDGTLYQCEDMIVRTNHAPGTPDFDGADTFVNYTSIGVELARFGKLHLSGGQYEIDEPEYQSPPFSVVDHPPAECDYSQLFPPPRGNHRFSLRKMRGEICLRATNRPYYYTKAATFDDERNFNRAAYPLDIVYTEEQYRTLLLWTKAMCEMHRIPKSLLVHPVTGKEQPWLHVTDLIQRDSATPQILAENKERVKAFQGIIGHTNIQDNRLDPGASVDYYRIKRGISDHWWYPVNLDDTIRAMDYLDTTRTADYMEMEEYRDRSVLDAYFTACEGTEGGYFPIGMNRLWHGGAHFPSGNATRRVHSMANGRVVAARIVNGEVETSTQCIELPFSRCFVLVRHEVHVRQNATATEEIEYGDDSTETVYSLYMHAAPLTVRLAEDGTFPEDYAAYPTWFNHHMIDYATSHAGATDPAPLAGRIFYPNQPVELGDWIAGTGNYVVGMDGANPVFGPVLHMEVFTTADVSLFGDSPWSAPANRVEDPTEDLVCDLSALDTWLQDAGNPGIDDLDIRSAIPRMRGIAVKNRSEWSIETLDQLCNELVVGAETSWRLQPTAFVTQNQFESFIRPLCFHADMVADGADPVVIGPFLEDYHVWHVHPLEFMRWMNDRVDRHESLMRAQDKRRTVNSTLVVAGEFVTGFVNAVPSVAPGAGYPEAAWGDNTYETTVDRICDRVDLAAGPQTTTRFHVRLLDALDMINDRPHGVDVLLTFARTEANANSSAAAEHTQGRACDLRPGTGTTAATWYGFFQSVVATERFLNNRDGAGALVVGMLQDASTTSTPPRTQVDSTPASREWLRRLTAATSATDPVLSVIDPAFPNLLAELGQMRLHLRAG